MNVVYDRCSLLFEISENQSINIIKKIRLLTYKLRLTCDTLTDSQLITLYYALLLSYLSYGVLTWGGVDKAFNSKLIMLHKQILQIIFRKPVTYPTDVPFLQSDILNPRQLYFLYTSIYFNKHENNQNIIYKLSLCHTL